MDPARPVSAATRRLLTGWLALSVGSLVVAGLFAALAAFTRTPAVQLLPTADLFHHALVSHVTFAFTVWFVAFAGALWVYAAWRVGAPLAARPSWLALGLATAGAMLMAVPAVLASGKPYLNDYVPVIDQPLFWAGLLLVTAGVSLQAAAYLWALAAGRARAAREPRAAEETPEGLAMAVGAVAMLLAVAALVAAILRSDPTLPFGYRLRVLVWGPGHLLQFLHVAGAASVWLVAAAVLGALPRSGRRMTRRLLWSFGPFMAATALAYVVWRPEELLVSRLVTVLTFGGLGAGAVPLALIVTAGLAWHGAPARPWSSPLFAGTVLSVALFAVGGALGVAGFSQDTRVPAHYHGMVGAVTLAYMGLAPALLELCGRRPWSERLTRWQPYLYGLGLLGLMAGLHWAGGHGAPRKTFGFTWADSRALIALNVMGAGSVLAILGGLAFVLNVGLPLLSRGARPSRRLAPVPAPALAWPVPVPLVTRPRPVVVGRKEARR